MHEMLLCTCAQSDARLRACGPAALSSFPMDADEPPWHELADLFDDTWYIECDVDVAMERVYDRQVAALHSYRLESQHWTTFRILLSPALQCLLAVHPFAQTWSPACALAMLWLCTHHVAMQRTLWQQQVT